MRIIKDDSGENELKKKETRLRIIDLICFVGGPFLAVYSSFSYLYSLTLIVRKGQTGAALGVALICLGFLVRDWRKKRDKSKEPRAPARGIKSQKLNSIWLRDFS